jgi:hypothetical protein
VQRGLEPDGIDADVVVVVDPVVGDPPLGDVAVDDDRLARPECQVVDLVVSDDEVPDRVAGPVAVRRDAWT